MADNIKNRLAELAELAATNISPPPVEPPPAEVESDADFIARMERREARIIQWAMQREKKEIAKLYAAALLWAMETRKSNRVYNSIQRQTGLIADEALARATAAGRERKSLFDMLVQEKSGRHKGAVGMHAKNPASQALAKIRTIWIAAQKPGASYPGDAAFAKDMHVKYAASIKNEGSIKNAISRWRKSKPSSR